ncbi:MAG: branched-chain amino acid ABC transporter permease [Candidatus Caldarchaeales archaeon]
MIDVLVDGVSFGLQLAMLGVGLTVVYGIAGVLNLSHGEWVVAATVSASLLTASGLHPALAAPAALLPAVLLSILTWSLLRPLQRLGEEERSAIGLVVTLALALALHGVFTSQFATAHYSFQVPVGPITVAGFDLRPSSLISSATAALVLASLHLFVTRTRTGISLRATFQNPRLAELQGIDVGRMRSAAFVLSALLAGGAGLLLGTTASVDPASGLELTLLSLIVCILGGVRSVRGVVSAGVALGVTDSVLSYLIGAYLSQFLLLMVASAVLASKVRLG